MFKVRANPTFWAKVRLTVAGQEVPERVEVEFHHKTQAALNEFTDRLKSGELTERDGMLTLVNNWKGFDEPFSREALCELFEQHPTALGEFYGAYRQQLLESRVKN